MFCFPVRCLSLTIACLLGFTVYGGMPDTSTRRGTSICTAPLQVLVLEIPLHVEFKRGRTAFGFSAAYRHRSNGNYDHGGLVDLLGKESMSADFLTSYRRAIAMGVNYKRYFRNGSHWYSDVHLFYRRWWDNGMGVVFPGRFPQYSNGADDTHVYGSKFLIGHTAFLSRKGRVRPVLHAFCGAGLRWHHSYSSTIVYPAPGVPSYTLSSRDNAILPSFQLGFTIGAFIVSRVQ